MNQQLIKITEKKEFVEDVIPSVANKIRFSDFCAGIGGFRLGLEKVGMECVLTIENDPNSLKTYNANHRDDVDAIDVFDVDADKIPDFDVMCAGFPCQPFSIAGQRRGFADPRGTVIQKLLEIVGKKKPKVLFFENVPHLQKVDSGTTFEKIISDINQLGYQVYFDNLDSADFGVPQHRKRLFIVAIRTDVDELNFEMPVGQSEHIPFRKVIHHGDDSIPISQKWQEYINLYTGKISENEVTFQLPKTRKKIERIEKGADIKNCVFQIRSSGIRALSIDKPLPTFAVSISGGGAMIPVYSAERRHLNMTEMKRLMGFPDDFIFPVSRTFAIKQLANSVCPQVITAIGKSIMQALKNTS